MAGVAVTITALGCGSPFTIDDSTQTTTDETGITTDNQLAGVPFLRDKGNYYLIGDDIVVNKNDAEHRELIAAFSEIGTCAKTTSMRYVCVPTWPNGVVTYSLTGFTSAEKTIIQNAMKTISDACKVKYVLTATNKAYVYKISKMSSSTLGGLSTIGYTSDAYSRLVSINTATCIHEFMHGLGFGHEHQRNDRDKYVTINTTNILSGYADQFQKVPVEMAYKVQTYLNGKITTTTKNVPYSSLVNDYDYGSIMHYPANAFAKSSNLVTINAKGKTIGKATTLSASDKAALVKVYGAK